MGAPVHVPPTRPSTPTIALPPTRPSTPIFGRIDRIAEAPSRADPHLPLVETSSPVQAPPTTMGVDFASEQGRINSNNQDEEPAQGDNQNEQNGHQAIASSDGLAPVVNGDHIANGDHAVPSEDMRLSSCSHRSYIPTPYNSPVARNPRQRSANGAPSTRLRGGGPKRPAGSPNSAVIKKSKVILKKSVNKKDRMLDDPEAVLADGNSPLYSDIDIAAVLQHPTAMNTLSRLDVGGQLYGLPQDAVRRAVNEFIENGKSGYNDPEHLGQCLAARDLRDKGNFDPYLEQIFRETWLVGEEDVASDENPANGST